MGKLGKKKLAELSELSKKQKFAECTDDENNTKNGATNDENKKEAFDKEAGAAMSTATADKIVSKKRKTGAASTKPTPTAESETDESDDLPLNGGSKSSVSQSNSNGPPRKKQIKQIPPKTKTITTTSAPASTKSDNNKKTAIKSQDKKTEDEEEEEDDNEESEFEVEAIVGHKSKRGESFFLVRWKGYGKDSDSWEPEAELNCDDLIHEYRKGNSKNAISKKMASKNVGRGRKAPSTKLQKQPSDPEKEWAVERILDFVDDDEHGGLYRIRWKGFGAKEDTWEPESNLSCEGLIEKFKKGLEQQQNVDVKHLRESPKKTKRLVNETIPRSNFHNRIERSSKRSVAKNRVFYGEE